LTYRESYIVAKDWKRRVALIATFHGARLAKNKDWKLTDSAKYFGLSIGLISESLNLSKHWDQIENCQSRSEALRKIKS
jgi:hypothetical protein